jgi:putative nucleotidyltransferase with HDIG domain
MALSTGETEDLLWGALLHDIGKVAVDPNIQNKPRALTEDEYAQIMTHIEVGPRIVRKFVNENILNIIKYHHSHYDGSKSNQVLVGDEIPINARIVALADAFDAMTSDRPYRKAFSIQEALQEIKKCAGSQFDPMLVDIFIKIPLSEIQAALRIETLTEVLLAA